jgi:hypothetical protein
MSRPELFYWDYIVLWLILWSYVGQPARSVKGIDHNIGIYICTNLTDGISMAFLVRFGKRNRDILVGGLVVKHIAS